MRTREENKMLLFLILSLVATAFGATTFDCEAGPPSGTFCDNDLTGFFKCSVNYHTNEVISERTACEKGTRCTCFINTKCPEDVKSPCQVPARISDIAKSFHTDFLENITTSSRTGVHKESYRKIIRYDGIKKRYAEDSTDLLTGKRYFTFYYINEYDVLRRDTGTYPDETGVGESCMNKVLQLRDFPSLFPDFYFYDKVSETTFTEKWVYKVGARTLGESATSDEWVFSKAPLFAPQSHEYNFFGSVQAAYTRKITKSFYLFLPEDNIGDAYFRSPAWCHAS